MYEAYINNVRTASYELFDILWEINTKESHEQMVKLVTEEANMGDDVSMGCLARAYWRGKGVDKDLNLALSWMKLASKGNLVWTKNELFDIIWEINNPDLDKELVEIIKPNIMKNDPHAQLRMGHAYRYGRGVEQNDQLAIEWLEKASKQLVRVKSELEELRKK